MVGEKTVTGCGVLLLILLQGNRGRSMKDQHLAEDMVLVKIHQGADDDPYEDAGHQAGDVLAYVPVSAHAWLIFIINRYKYMS